MGGGGMGGGMSPSPLGGLVQNPYAGEGHYLGGGGMGGMGGGGYLGEGPMPYGGEAGYRHGGLLGGSGGLFTSEHMTQLRREQEGPTPTRRPNLELNIDGYSLSTTKLGVSVLVPTGKRAVTIEKPHDEPAA
mmetsp:Transcript_46024/g.146213  ORF Transcript_46024/g.146213 Transcript_46024/m.146213 type:complete len:132 (+) Transcript_46024:148-543(+)